MLWYLQRIAETKVEYCFNFEVSVFVDSLQLEDMFLPFRPPGTFPKNREGDAAFSIYQVSGNGNLNGLI